MFLCAMNFLDVFFSVFPIQWRFFTRITIITFVFGYVFHDWLKDFPNEPLSWFSPPPKKLFTWFANVVIYLVIAIMWTIITCLFLLKGLAAWIALKVFHLPINNILVSVTFVISFTFMNILDVNLQILFKVKKISQESP